MSVNLDIQRLRGFKRAAVALRAQARGTAQLASSTPTRPCFARSGIRLIPPHSCEIIDAMRKNTDKVQYFLPYVVKITSPITYSQVQ